MIISYRVTAFRGVH